MMSDTERFFTVISVKKFLCILSVLCLVFLFSCTDNHTEQIVKEYSTAKEAAEICGILPVDFVPKGYNLSAYRTIYDMVYETEYLSDEKIAVLRMVSDEYSTSNLSGYTDTALHDVYTHSDGRVFEIETRENVFSCEWQENQGENICNLSLVLLNGKSGEFESMLAQTIAYFGGETN